MAQPHHTQAREEARRAPATTEFLQYPAATYTPRPHHTSRISQPIKQAQNGTSRQARRPHRNNDPLVYHSQKTLNTVRSGRNGLSLSRTRSRRILCNWILAAIVVLGIILTIVFTLKKIDKSGR